MRFSLTAMMALMLVVGCSETGDADAEKVLDEKGMEVVTRAFDPEKGRALFIAKGCVICHSVNGVGGKAAPALDAEIGVPGVDPLEFAARMWRGAPAMIELQAVELGYSIFLTADEIADLAAFSASRDQQKTLTAEELPESIRNGLLDEQFWEVEDWGEFLKTGREGDDFGDEEGPEDSPEE